MEFDWQLAEPLFAKIQPPGYGERESWMRWYREAWEHVCSQGLALVETPLDDCVIRLRIFALGWLAHDFCAAVLRDEWSTHPYWSEWIEQLEIDPTWCLLTGVDIQLLKHVVGESPLSAAAEIEDGEISIDHDEINEDLVPRLVMVEVYAQREKVVDALFRCFDGPGGLFTRMYSNCYRIEEEIEERRDELEDELAMLEERQSEVLPEKDREELRRQIESLRRELEESELVKGIVEEARLRSGGDPIRLGDEESYERMIGCEWCSSGCAIVVRGEPSFWLP